MAINYFFTKKCEILAETKDSNHILAYRPLLVNNTESKIDFHNVAKLNKLCVGEQLFQHRGTIYKDTLGTFKKHSIYNMPPGSFSISGTPMGTFSKQHGRQEPILDLDDLIKVSLLPSEEVEPGQKAVTFLPANERVLHPGRPARQH